MDLSKLIIPEEVQAPRPIVTCTIEGILDADDLRQIVGNALAPTEHTVPEEDNPHDLKKLREKHHSVARMIAGGMQQRMVAMISDYSESYLSVLLGSPAMQELVEMYRIQNGTNAQLVIEKLQTVGVTALEKLSERLDKNELNNNELLQTAKLGLDRADFGPSSKRHVVNENHSFDHTKLKELEAEARRGSAAHIVPTSEVRKALPKPRDEDGSDAG